MAHSSFGSGWPNCAPSSRIVTVRRADGVRFGIHRDLADLVAILMNETERRGYNIRPGDTGGYACRPVAGTRTASNHSWGTAVDINWRTNPRRSDRRFQSDMPKWMVDLWVGQGFRWGGRWRWPDPMHFEFTGTAAEARARAAKLRGTKPATPAKPAARPAAARNLRLVKPMMRGTDVRDWQTILRGAKLLGSRDIDGIFGPKTRSATVAFQRKLRVAADGIVGPKTRAATARLLAYVAALAKRR